MFLVVVDAHSKWPEVIPVSSTTSSSTIEVLRDLFARFGIPEQIVSDNGTQFVSEEFQAFIKSNGIRHITSAPYHPATNRLAERAVQTFKQALRSMHQSSKPHTVVCHCVRMIQDTTKRYPSMPSQKRSKGGHSGF